MKNIIIATLALVSLASVTGCIVEARAIKSASIALDIQKEDTFNVCVATGQYNNKLEYQGPCADVR